MRIVEAGLRRFALPLAAPLATAHGPVGARVGWLVTLADEAGRVGVGEATPLPSFAGEDLATCRAALRRALAARGGGLESMTRSCVGAPCARAAIEASLADLAAQRAGLSLAAWLRPAAGLAGAPAEQVRVQALVGGETPEAVAASAHRARDRGFEVFKLKLAVTPARRDPGRDVERVAALRQAVGASARIRLDGNEAWSLSQAESALARLAPFAIEFVEQPVARQALAEFAALDRTGPIPLAADESLLDGRIDACLARRIAGIFVVKQSILGGIPAALALAARAREQGIRLIHSNLFEGRVGRATAVSLAAALAEPGDEVHGLGTAQWLARDFDAPVFETGSPARLTTPAGPGLGCRASLRSQLPAELTPGADRVLR